MKTVEVLTNDHKFFDTPLSKDKSNSPPFEYELTLVICF